MKRKTVYFFIAGILLFSGLVFAAGNDTQASPESFGGQTGDQARQLKETAQADYAVASAKVAETSKKVQADAQDAFKTLQQQWNDLSKQLQASAQQLSQQLQKQLDDFNKSFNKPKQ